MLGLWFVRGLSLVAASGGHSSSRCAGLSLSRPLLLRSTGSRFAGSVFVAHGPSCSAACGIFPDQGSNPCPLHWQADSQLLRHQGSPVCIFNRGLILGFFLYILSEFLSWAMVQQVGMEWILRLLNCSLKNPSYLTSPVPAQLCGLRARPKSTVKSQRGSEAGRMEIVSPVPSF